MTVSVEVGTLIFALNDAESEVSASMNRHDASTKSCDLRLQGLRFCNFYRRIVS